MKLSKRSQSLTQSAIRSASSRCNQIGGINLGQGICDVPIDNAVKEAAYHAIQDNHNLYSDYAGVEQLREAIAHKLQNFNAINVKDAREIMVGHGATGAYVSAAMVLFNPGDEVILFEPFYGYHKNILALQGVDVHPVSIDLETFEIDWQGLEQAITNNTRAIVICTPCNPSGKVFTQEELTRIGGLAKQHDLWIITDEMYEYITYPGHEHFSIASLEEFAPRTITLSGMSKTYNMTGWRLGYAHGPVAVIEKMGLLQDLLYVCPATPLQHAAVAAFQLPESYYENMRAEYSEKRDIVLNAMEDLNLTATAPQGAYYIMADVTSLGYKNDVDAVQGILEGAKVACVPGSAFYANPTENKQWMRICYSVDKEKVAQAMDNMKKCLKKS